MQVMFELHQIGMHSCMKKKSNEDHDNAQLRKSEIDTLKCASVNEKLEAEVINMGIAAILVRHKKSRQMVKTCSMLDKSNQGPFIKEESIEELRITGRKLKLIRQPFACVFVLIQHLHTHCSLPNPAVVKVDR